MYIYLVGGPDEGLGFVVGLGDEAVDGGLWPLVDLVPNPENQRGDDDAAHYHSDEAPPRAHSG
jgi:hypothetical protein